MNYEASVQLFYLSIELVVIYDLMQMCRTRYALRIVTVATLDTLFWAITIWKILEFIHKFGNGLLRWYHMLQILLVVYIYRMYFSKYFKKIVSFLAQKLVILLTFIKRLVIIKGTKGGHRHGKEKKSASEVS